MKDLPWYKDGLHFKCTECGQCCTGSPGYVWLTEEDIAELVAQLGMGREEFIRKYTRLVFGRLAFLEHPRTYDCIFLDGKKCKVYQTRPRQCRSFPWWSEHLTSKEAWQEAAARCEGIDHPDAPLIPCEDIRKQLD